MNTYEDQFNHHTAGALDRIFGAFNRPTPTPPAQDEAKALTIKLLMSEGAKLTAQIEHPSTSHDRIQYLNGRRDEVLAGLRRVTDGATGSGRRFEGSAWADENGNPPMPWIAEMRELAATVDDV